MFPTWKTGPRLGSRGVLEAYATMPWLRSLVQKVSEDVACLTWRVYVPVDKHGMAVRDKRIQRSMRYHDRRALLKTYEDQGQLRELTDHPLVDFLCGGSDFFSGMVSLQVTQAHLDLVGETVWIIEPNEFGMPVAGVPIPPTWIMNTPRETGGFYRVVGPGATWEIPKNRMFYAYHPDMANPFGRGTGISQVLADELETDEFAAKHCHDHETECLTRRGWVPGLSLTMDDEIATWDGSRVEFQKPVALTRARYAGLMHHWHGQSVDAMVTPTHRLWIAPLTRQQPQRREEPSAWQFEESQAARRRRTFHWQVAGVCDGYEAHVEIPAYPRLTKRKPGSRGGGRAPMFGVDEPFVCAAVDFASFLGYYVSEGSPDHASATVCQSEGRYVDDIRAALRVFKPEWVRERSEIASGKRRYRWSVNHFGLTEWLRVHVGEGSARKRLPDIVYQWPLEARLALLVALLRGDGHQIHQPAAKTTRRRRARSESGYSTRSEQLADDVQRLCCLMGYAAIKHVCQQRGAPMYTVVVSESGNVQRLDRQGAWTTDHAYDGLVWCVTVKNERFFSRRNGRVMLGGNTKDWFRNRAIPPVLISGLGVNVNELQRLEEKWLAKFTRRGAGWLPHFLGSKVDVHQLSQSFQQQELGALRDRERDMIREVFGVPPEIMGHVANSNRSTIDASDFIYQSRVIVPRAEFLRSSAQMSIVPLFDDRLILDYVSPVAEDREFALKVRQAAPWAWSADEWRDLGLTQPLPEGKGAVHAVPFSIVFSNQFAATPEPGPALPARAQRMVTRASADDAIDAIVNAVEFEVLESAGLPVIRAAIAHFGQSTVETALEGSGIDFHFDLRDPAVEDHLRTWGAQRMGEDVSETTKAAIRESLAEGLEEGETFDELVDRIGSVFDVDEGRLESIVTTELNRSSNFAAELGLKQAGFSDKEWLATKDDQVRDTHAALDGTIVGIDEDFVSASGASGPYPGELGEANEDINCRCAVITVLAERSFEAKTAQWKTLQSEKAPYEKRLRAALSKAFDAQEAAVIVALKESGIGATSSRMAKPQVPPAVPVRSEPMPINVHVEPSAVTVNLPAPIIHVPAPVVHVESPTVTLSAPAVHVPVTVSSGRHEPEVVKVPARRRRVERDADNRIVALIDEPMDVALPLETGEHGKER